MVYCLLVCELRRATNGVLLKHWKFIPCSKMRAKPSFFYAKIMPIWLSRPLTTALAGFPDISRATTFLQRKVGTNLAWSLPEITIGTILARPSGWQDLEEKIFLFFYRKPLDRFVVLWYTLGTVKERGKQNDKDNILKKL